MKNILIAEDEDAIRDFVVINLKRAGYNVTDVNNGLDAVAVYDSAEEPFDVVILDVMMPKINGFRLASELKEKSPDTIIIFVSAYDDFVYSSFEYAPFRFLRKSHLEEELPATFKKVIEKCISDEEALLFETTDGDTLLRLRDIMYFEGEKNYFIIKMTSGKEYRCRGTMTSVEDRVKPYDFFRIHSAFIVNEEHIESIHEDGYLSMKNGFLINISRRKLVAFKESYMQFTRRRFAK